MGQSTTAVEGLVTYKRDSPSLVQDLPVQSSNPNASQDIVVYSAPHALLEHSSMITHLENAFPASINQQVLTTFNLQKLPRFAATSALSTAKLTKTQNAWTHWMKSMKRLAANHCSSSYQSSGALHASSCS